MNEKLLLYLESVLRYIVVISAGLLLTNFVALNVPEFYGSMFFGTKDPAYPFSFQMIMWIPFYIGISDLVGKIWHFKRRHKAMENDILAGSERIIYTPKDLVNILDTTKSFKPFKGSILPELIKQVIIKYQTSGSIADATDTLESMVEIFEKRLDLFYTKIRYISWLIPTLGFIGTVYGISLSVALVGKASPDDPTLLQNIATSLAIAFDTTLLALVQAAILLFISNIIENMEFRFISDSNQYVFENLINRLDPHESKK